MLTKVIFLINKHLFRARNKHPKFASNYFHIVSLACEELGEMAQAVNDGNIEKAKDEALDLMAVLVRFIEEDNSKQ